MKSRASKMPFVHQFVKGEPDGRCHSSTRRPIILMTCWEAAMLDSLSGGLRLVGNRVVNAVWRIGFAARFSSRC